MPTGYTAKLMDEGQSFQEFVLTCARQFGALIMMRDESLDAPIPDQFEPSDYYSRELSKAKATLVELGSMSDDQRLAFGINKKAEEVEQAKAWLCKGEKQNARISEMRAHVLRWQPPTTDHQELKVFMLNQLRISENDIAYSAERLRAVQQGEPLAFYREAVSQLARNIPYCEREHAKEVERTKQRNEWLRALRMSLKPWHPLDLEYLPAKLAKKGDGDDE